MGGELELLVGVLRCFEFFRIDSSVTLVNDKNENGRIPILEMEGSSPRILVAWGPVSVGSDRRALVGDFVGLPPCV